MLYLLQVLWQLFDPDGQHHAGRKWYPPDPRPDRKLLLLDLA